MKNNLNLKNHQDYFCKVCDYSTSRASQYERHIKTAKHIRLTDAYQEAPNSITKHICKCGKELNHRQSLHRHKRSCNGEPVLTTPTVFSSVNETNQSCLSTQQVHFLDANVRQQEDTSELKMLLKEQQGQTQTLQNQMQIQQKQLQEILSQVQHITNNSNSTNDSNKRFNLKFFLNEQCKDAISIEKFLQNLNIGIVELEHMGNVGYVEGMMSIFSKSLGVMDIYKRPLHCTDLKRQTIYIKQGDIWKKDTDDRTELRKLIKIVENKNYESLRLWEREHPEAFECDTQDNIDYMRISNEALGGFDSTEAIKMGKIMRHVVGEVYIK